LVPDRTKETARKKLELSSTSKRVKYNKENCQEHSVNKLVNKKISVKNRAERGKRSQQLNFVCMKKLFLFPRNGQGVDFYALNFF